MPRYFLGLPHPWAVPFVKLEEEVNYLLKSCPERVAICKAGENQRETASKKIECETGMFPASEACLEWPEQTVAAALPGQPSLSC